MVKMGAHNWLAGAVRILLRERRAHVCGQRGDLGVWEVQGGRGGQPGLDQVRATVSHETNQYNDENDVTKLVSSK